MTTEDQDEFQVLRRRWPVTRRSTDGIVIGASAVTVGATVLFIISVVISWPIEVQLLTIAAALFAFLIGFRRLFAATYPQVEAAEPRPRFADEPDEVPEIVPVARRTFLVRTLTAAAAALGLAALAPVVSLGPRYRPTGTGWADGVRLVTSDGEPITPEQVDPAGMAVVWPEGAIGDEQGTVLLTRLVVEPVTPTRLDWVVDGGVVAYSRICTHAGCAIGIYRDADAVMYCPCHQAQFDLSRGAEPIFGPADRPLPQLPLGVDPDGYLVALGDFAAPVGPPRG